MKLEGLRVLDLSRFLPGPYVTLMMSDHGAEVIAIEAPGEGEPARHIGPRVGEHTVWFRNTNRGKKSLTLDLKNAEDRQFFLDLAKDADVIVESFRPGVAARLGVDYKTISAFNPRIVYLSIAAFGQTGPLANVAGHDVVIGAIAGVLSLNVDRDSRPVLPHMPVSDITVSSLGLSGVLMALYRREKTGRGDYIDMSMHDATLSWVPHTIGPVFAWQKPPEPKLERSWGGHAFIQIYETKDKRFVALCGAEKKFVVNLLEPLGRPDLIAATLEAPGAAHEPVKAFLREEFAKRTRDEWTEWFKGRDVAFAPVLNLVEGVAHPQVAAREMVLKDADGLPQLGNPIKFLHDPAVIDTRVPGMGEHDEELGKRPAARVSSA
ncbi:CaiB/BaiF CoA transferase family protein [Ramlibacter sp.]|uniref:CaiB/BaiF CoA transferase family protein n=1 Tax=Ramlibacter sp. TaxID=1917967 RepID=UPI003D13FDCB